MNRSILACILFFWLSVNLSGQTTLEISAGSDMVLERGMEQLKSMM